MKIGDACGIMGILRLYEGDSFTASFKIYHNELADLGDSYLILVTNVLSVGQLYNCDVYKVTNVQFLQLNREPSDLIDQRIADVGLVH